MGDNAHFRAASCGVVERASFFAGYLQDRWTERMQKAFCVTGAEARTPSACDKNDCAMTVLAARFGFVLGLSGAGSSAGGVKGSTSCALSLSA